MVKTRRSIVSLLLFSTGLGVCPLSPSTAHAATLTPLDKGMLVGLGGCALGLLGGALSAQMDKDPAVLPGLTMLAWMGPLCFAGGAAGWWMYKDDYRELAQSNEGLKSSLTDLGSAVRETDTKLNNPGAIDFDLRELSLEKSGLSEELLRYAYAPMECLKSGNKVYTLFPAGNEEYGFGESVHFGRVRVYDPHWSVHIVAFYSPTPCQKPAPGLGIYDRDPGILEFLRSTARKTKVRLQSEKLYKEQNK